MSKLVNTGDTYIAKSLRLRKRKLQHKSKLKPCPFCGGKAEQWQRVNLVVAGCKKCGCILFNERTSEEAISAWNRRVK